MISKDPLLNVRLSPLMTQMPKEYSAFQKVLPVISPQRLHKDIYPQDEEQHSVSSRSMAERRPSSKGKLTQKKCSKCGELQPITEFPKHDTSSDGFAAYCKTCKNGLSKERRLKDPIARLTHYTVTRIKNEWPKEEIPKDIQTNLEFYLGYKLFDLKRKLMHEVQDMYGISLIQSFKDGYHLDHIQPHSSFESNEIGDEEFQKCWAISNLRMIPSKENLQKGAKLDYYA